MLKKILASLLAFLAMSVFAAVDVNKASASDLDAVKGIGPAIAAKIAAERTKAPFKDWEDLIARVSGIGEKSAAKLSEAGLTVNGSGYKGATAVPTPSAKAADRKPATAIDPGVATTAAPAPVATPAATPAAPAKSADVKGDAKVEAAKAKADAKAAAKAERQAAREQAAKYKADAKAAAMANAAASAAKK
jgi:competence protein ComEA